MRLPHIRLGPLRFSFHVKRSNLKDVKGAGGEGEGGGRGRLSLD
jgi:hypothetical protein